MAFTSFTFPARYGSSESAGLRLPANVSRNTPATEAGDCRHGTEQRGWRTEQVVGNARKASPFVLGRSVRI